MDRLKSFGVFALASLVATLLCVILFNLAMVSATANKLDQIGIWYLSVILGVGAGGIWWSSMTEPKPSATKPPLYRFVFYWLGVTVFLSAMFIFRRGAFELGVIEACAFRAVFITGMIAVFGSHRRDRGNTRYLAAERREWSRKLLDAMVDLLRSYPIDQRVAELAYLREPFSLVATLEDRKGWPNAAFWNYAGGILTAHSTYTKGLAIASDPVFKAILKAVRALVLNQYQALNVAVIQAALDEVQARLEAQHAA